MYPSSASVTTLGTRFALALSNILSSVYGPAVTLPDCSTIISLQFPLKRNPVPNPLSAAGNKGDLPILQIDLSQRYN